MISSPRLAGIGEVLWDRFPDGDRLGGAPAHFAFHAGQLGAKAHIISKIGSDSDGERLSGVLQSRDLADTFIQKCTTYSTGVVRVAINAGQPTYVIEHPVAWDFIRLTDDLKMLASELDGVCFGTLAQRRPVSRQTIEGFLAATSSGCVRVFDVNLRAPFYSASMIERSLQLTTLLKMNDSEMPLILTLVGLGSEAGDTTAEGLLAGARLLLERFPVQLVCVTMGSSGSLLVTREQVDRHRGIPARVVDTVGAGDAFTAALTHYYLQKAPLSVINDAGNRWGSWVASQPGAMPPLDSATQDAITAAVGQPER